MCLALDLGSVEKKNIHLAHLIVTLSCCSLTTSKQRLAKTCSLIVQVDSHLKALGISFIGSTSDGYPKKSVDRIPFSSISCIWPWHSPVQHLSDANSPSKERSSGPITQAKCSTTSPKLQPRLFAALNF